MLLVAHAYFFARRYKTAKKRFAPSFLFERPPADPP